MAGDVKLVHAIGKFDSISFYNSDAPTITYEDDSCFFEMEDGSLTMSIVMGGVRVKVLTAQVTDIRFDPPISSERRSH